MITRDQFLGLDDSKLVNFKDDPKRMLVLLGDRDAVKALGPLFADAYDNGFEIVEITQENEWVCITAV